MKMYRFHYNVVTLWSQGFSSQNVKIFTKIPGNHKQTIDQKQVKTK